jgi:hypothetical protein
MSIDQIKQHLDTVMELTETQIPEGDFITISNSLKDIYDTATAIAKSRSTPDDHTIHSSHFTPNSFVTVRDQRINNISFRLTLDEQRIVMFARLETYYNELTRPIEEQIRILSEQLKEIVVSKKEAFEEFKLTKSFDGVMFSSKQMHTMLINETKLSWKQYLDDEKFTRNALYDLKEELRELRVTEQLRKTTMENIHGLD